MAGSPAGSGSYLQLRHFGLAPIGFEGVYGGMSLDQKLSTKSPQFYYARHIDFRKAPSQVTVLPQGPAETSGTVTDLILDMDQTGTGDRYAVGDSGRVYHVTTAGAWTNYGNIGENSGAGLIYRSDVDHTYITGQDKIARIKRTANAPTWQPNWFGSGVSSSSTCYMIGGQNTYTPAATIKEDTPDTRSFTSDIDPVIKIGVKVINPGTGDWTLTLHNDANDILGTATIVNANLKINQINYFVFAGPIRIQRGDSGAGSALTYHFHLVSTQPDGTIATTTTNSIQDCDMELWANALVTTNNGLHPVANFTNWTVIGNGNYMAQYEPLQDNPQMNVDYLPHRLTFPPGYEVCGFAQKNLLLVIGCEKRSPTGDFQDGALFFWDGVSQTYNDWWPVPEGSPESLFAHDNVVNFIAGGAHYQIVSTDQPKKMRTFRNTDSEYSNIADSTHVYPNMMTIRRGMLLLGYPSYTTNQLLEHGVYSYGQTDVSYPLSYGFNYTITTGTILNNGSNNLKIGMVKNFGDTLYTSWRDDSASPRKYGVDVTDNTSPPANFIVIESTRFDGGALDKEKSAKFIIATFESWPTDSTLKLKYKIDREANWHYSTDADITTVPPAGSRQFIFPVPDANQRFFELEYGLEVNVGTTTPVLTSLYAYVDMQILERPGVQ